MMTLKEYYSLSKEEQKKISVQELEAILLKEQESTPEQIEAIEKFNNISKINNLKNTIQFILDNKENLIGVQAVIEWMDDNRKELNISNINDDPLVQYIMMAGLNDEEEDRRLAANLKNYEI